MMKLTTDKNKEYKNISNPCPPQNCTGCGVCTQVCPFGAIQMIEDALLCSTISYIDSNKCKKCNLCIEACPQRSISKANEPRCCFVSWINPSIRPLHSSSGGLAYACSESILEQNGYVCGCAMINGRARHILISRKDDLSLLCGSKYIQSEIGDNYRTIKRLLSQGRKILFIGTPCQIDGLYHMVDRNNENLYTIDLICHGVPIQLLWEQWAEANYKNYKNSILTFRKGTSFLTTFYDSKTHKELKKFILSRNYYLSAFLSGISYRENCYICQYARPHRLGDLTLGDFWGIDKNVERNIPEAPSLLLVNTDKGKVLFDTINNIEAYEMDYILAIEHNAQLREPMPKPNDRSYFIAYNPIKNFNIACEKTPCLKNKHISSFQMIYIMIKRLIKRLLFII